MNVRHFVILLTVFLALVSTTTFAAPNSELLPFQYIPPDGFIPDADTAVNVSRVVLIRIYGQAQIEMEKPLRATLADGIWIVKGTMPPGLWEGPPNCTSARRMGQFFFYLTEPKFSDKSTGASCEHENENAKFGEIYLICCSNAV